MSHNDPEDGIEVLPFLDEFGDVLAPLVDENGKMHTPKLADIVWEAFNGPIPDGQHVTHIDGDKNNNRLINLKLTDTK
ncbi:HNH endonuclease signature motif containing protein [Corynebacterium sp. A21]|uniref:HNH endonuclease signature motif containing protein n=1 Tax=Corynebacterium sp. A21 TaxID=3457318 RepID=UPI003FD3828F